MAEVKVTRSEHHSVQLLVGAWEILVLQYEHSPEKVEVLGFKKLEGRQYPDPQQEFERLTQRYGIETENGATKASLVYGQGQMGVNTLQRLIEQEMKAEETEGADLEVVSLTQNVVEFPVATAATAAAAPTPPTSTPVPTVAAVTPTEVIPSKPTLGLPRTKSA